MRFNHENDGSPGTMTSLEISAVNGRFILSFIQPFRDDRYLRSFLAELDDNYVYYDLMDEGEMILPGVDLPF